MKSYTVYIHVNKDNGKVYIGQTCQSKLNLRWSDGRGYAGSPHFAAAIKKYGWDGFCHDVLRENLTQEEANYFEQYFIEYFDSTNPECGYNVQLGGRSAGGMSPEGRISLALHNTGENSPVKRHIVAFDTSGAKLGEFPLIAVAADHFGIKHSTLNSHMRRGKGTCHEMIFKYKDDVGDITQLPPGMIYRPHEKRSLRAKNPPKIPVDRSAPRPYRRKPISQYSSAGIYIKDSPSIYDAASEVGATPTAIQGAVYSDALCAGFLWRRATGDTSPISPAKKRGEKKRLTGGSTARRIDQIDLKTGQVVQTFVSVRAAARFVNRDKANLTQVANGVKKSSAGFGWRWHLE